MCLPHHPGDWLVAQVWQVRGMCNKLSEPSPTLGYVRMPVILVSLPTSYISGIYLFIDPHSTDHHFSLV
jgi:hypothetical protein